ncbi:MAG: amino acid ABC transporter substrate-binding protein, partial [Shewanella xiamenensis]
MLLCVIPHTAQATLNIYTEEWAPISFSVDGQPDGLAVQVVQE